jgi:putative transcriptional regulator
MQSPTPEMIKKARKIAGLSARQAAELIHCTVNAWQKWEADDREMHPAFWDLFLIKTHMRNFPDVERCRQGEPCDCLNQCGDDKIIALPEKSIFGGIL